MPECLTEDQIAHYRDLGYLLLPSRIPPDVMNAVRTEITRLTAPARRMEVSDDKLDLEDSHTPDAPRVRRIKLPHTQSKVMDQLMRSDWILGPVRDLLGPNIRLQTTKLNMKTAGYGAAVEWHQDWAFYPYTNDDVLAVGVIVDDMAEENGPLMVFPGSHKGPVHDHHHEGYFAGAMDLGEAGLDVSDAAMLTGPGGSISIHHVRAVHGSALNRSDRDRRVLFYEMMAADAFPVSGSRGRFDTLEEFNSRLLCGEPTLEPRVVACPIRVPYPEPPTTGSIYEIQKAMGKRSFEVAE